MQTSPIIELPDETADFVTVQAVVHVPALNENHRNLLKIVGGSLGEETESFTRSQIADIAGRVGGRLRVWVSNDHLRVSMYAVPADMRTAIAMVGSVLKEPVLRPEVLQSVGDDLQSRRYSFWRQALEMTPFALPKYESRDMEWLRTTVFRPENVTVAVAGKFLPGQASQKWQEFLDDWHVGRLPRPEPDEARATTGVKIGSLLSLIELRGPVFSARDANISTKILALIALGTGKDSSLFRVGRERMGIAYRLEGVLTPDPAGFIPRLLVARSQSVDLEKSAEELRVALMEDVKDWTDSARTRAIGMAESVFVKGGDFNPYYFGQERPITRELGDQAFLAAYWQMKTGIPWNPYQFVGRLGFVELADLKQEAENFLAHSILITRSGKS
ncbi:MAG: insulinase family protein [Fimbriimonadaceae bacterium]|nr:insulinase family protein [Fimbriimonadaceae bacterium]